MGQLKMTGRRFNVPAGAITLIPLCCLCFCGEVSLAADEAKPEIKIGSKKFTESVILGEMLAFLARDVGASSIHRAELGGSDILWKALLRGDIDIYPEYTGTLKAELLRGEPDIAQALAERGLRTSKSLGFNDSY